MDLKTVGSKPINLPCGRIVAYCTRPIRRGTVTEARGWLPLRETFVHLTNVLRQNSRGFESLPIHALVVELADTPDLGSGA